MLYNNYFEDGLLAWEANVGIHQTLDYYKVLNLHYSRLLYENLTYENLRIYEDIKMKLLV